jgi:tetratricopeptide (TPR) repeat protein
MGLVYHVLGEQDLALKHIEQSLLIRREVGDRSGEGRTLNHLGLVYASMGQSDKAYNYYKTSLVIRRDVGDLNGEGVILYNIGKLYVQNHHYKVSLACFLNAQNIFKEVQSTKQDATKKWIEIVRQRVGNAQFTLLLREIEPHLSQITERTLFKAL